ncbi:hypothetical protein M9X92_001042 [Pyricularia oryzae]|nr:hypothetical protein M9X92_001042 [Pyricularia oryzae]
MEPLTRLLGDAHRFVPDVKLYINFLNELSVVPAPEAATQCDGDGHKAQKQSMRTYLSHHSITMHCLRLVRYEATSFPSRQHLRWTTALESSSIPSERELVRNPKAQKNLHETPNFAFQHGFVMRPATLRRLSSWWDHSWGAEKNAVYWAGSSTGGHWTAHTWAKGHPQRLVALATGKAETSTGAKVDISHRDVALTRIVGCEPRPVCDAMSRFFWGGLPDTTTGGRSSRGPDPENRALRYRFALDVNGNSFSGRFYRRLASRGVPLKINIFREWHDDRLRAWVHYVPFSVSMEEMPELMRVLTSTATGQRISRSIAEARREWHQLAVSPQHQGIYLYRLMLEMTRVRDGRREANYEKKKNN